MTNKIKIIKILFIVFSVTFILPSTVYMAKNGTVYGFGSSFNFLLTNNINRLPQMLLFLGLFVILAILYFGILKIYKKLFNNIKQILIYVAIISVIFALMLPFTSTDVFYYIGIGWLQSKYDQNPYYISMNDFMEQNSNAQNDKILLQGAADWGDQKVVYGPIWTSICALLSGMSLGSVNLALAIFKAFAVIINILNTYLIYKITRKKLPALIYGLNPFILIEAISNVHNDIYLIFFTLLSLYYLIRKKNIVASVMFLALGACIKYITLLLLPFVVLYYFRKEDKLSVRFLNCLKYGALFLVVVCVAYIFYIQDLNILNGILDQQGKYTKSIQTVLNIYGFSDLEQLQKILTIGFFAICIIVYINVLTKKHITINYALKQYNILLYLFMVFIITNFEPWYIMWLFPTMFYQTGKAIKQIVGISLVSQIANCTFLLHAENYLYSTHFVAIMTIGIAIIWICTSRKFKKICEL